MADKCVICGKSVAKSVSSERYPEKHVCLSCLNGLVFNASTLAEELEPITEAFTKAFDEIKNDVEKGNK